MNRRKGMKEMKKKKFSVRILSMFLAFILLAGCVTVPAQKVDAAAARKGWYKTAYDNWYYYKNGVKQKGWLTSGGHKYYLGTKGAMVKGLKKISGRYYYFSPSKTKSNPLGSMVRGWKKINNKWYYFKPSGSYAGSMLRNQWVSYKGEWYFLQKNGVMKAGDWQTWKGERYYLTSDGSMRIGWLQYQGKYYYFISPSGKMARSTTLTIGGKQYKFKSNGVYYK